MTHADMPVVVYKILSYIYDREKQGIRVERAEIAHYSELLDIPYPYWENVIEDLVEKKLVRGVYVRHHVTNTEISISDPSITLDGVQFLEENAMMRKAYNFLRDDKEKKFSEETSRRYSAMLAFPASERELTGYC